MRRYKGFRTSGGKKSLLGFHWREIREKTKRKTYGTQSRRRSGTCNASCAKREEENTCGGEKGESASKCKRIQAAKSGLEACGWSETHKSRM